jgi:excisionase family DNA binding protein
MADGEQIQFTFQPTVVPQGDGSYLVRPGKPIVGGMLRVAEVAKRLDVTERHVCDLIDEGMIAAVDVGGGGRIFWRVGVEELEKFIKSRGSLREGAD